jgi:hypothetical protein
MALGRYFGFGIELGGAASYSALLKATANF